MHTLRRCIINIFVFPLGIQRVLVHGFVRRLRRLLPFLYQLEVVLRLVLLLSRRDAGTHQLFHSYRPFPYHRYSHFRYHQRKRGLYVQESEK